MSPLALGTAIGAAAVTVGRGAAQAAGDGLSFGAALLRGASGESQEAGEACQKPASGLPAELKQRIDDLTAQIRRQLAAAGIKLTKPLELTSNGAGGISVSSDDPLREAIQQALNSDILLERDFDHLASDYAEFAEEHADVPSALMLVVTGNG